MGKKKVKLLEEWTESLLVDRYNTSGYRTITMWREITNLSTLKKYSSFLHYIVININITSLKKDNISSVVNNYIHKSSENLNFNILRWCNKHNVILDKTSLDILNTQKYNKLLKQAVYYGFISTPKVNENKIYTNHKFIDLNYENAPDNIKIISILLNKFI